MKIDPELLLRLLLDILAAVGAAFAFFKWLGQRWLEDKFARKLEDHRAKVNSLFSRISKIHDKEFEVLPEAWRLLQDAKGRVWAVAGPLKTHPDLNRMQPEKLEEFLNSVDLKESEKADLRMATDKTKHYIEVSFWQQLFGAQTAVNDFHNYLLYNKIFLNSDLFTLFSKIDNALSGAVIEQRIGKEAEDFKMLNNYYRETNKEIESLTEEIELLVQKRLHYPEAQCLPGNPIG